MEAEQYLSFLVNQIHTVIAATSDSNGHPVTCAIDIMDSDADSLYFLTARGKSFYHRLKEQQFIALTGIKGNDTMSSVAISIRGHVEESNVLERLLRKNQYMYEIYPSEESRKALCTFRIFDGTGEFFDLSSKPIVRRTFSFGGKKDDACSFLITENCNGCAACLSSCPQQCIIGDSVPFHISNDNCLMCGRCAEVCPRGAVIRGSL